MTRIHAATILVVLAAGCQPAADFPSSNADSVAVIPPPPAPPTAGQPLPPPPATDPDTGVPPGVPSEPVVSPQPTTVPVPEPARDSAVTPQPPLAAAAPADCEVAVVRSVPATRIVTVYYTCREEERPVRRRVPETLGVLRAALEELLRGPTGEERSAGFRSFFSGQTAGMLNSVIVGSDGVARIDFDDFSRLIPNASSSAGSAQLLGQLRETIFQFPTVRAATITFNGDCDAFWNWLQRDCERLEPG